MRRQHEANLNTGPHFDSLYAGYRRGEMMANPTLKSLLPLLVKEGRVLDLGCGWGQYHEILTQNGARYTGIDFAANAIEEAREHYPESQWKPVDFSERLPFQSGTFDYVVCLETLEHLPKPHRTVDEIARVLTEGGLAIIGVPYGEMLAHVEEHLWAFEDGDWQELMTCFREHSVLRFSVASGEWEHYLVIGRK